MNARQAAEAMRDRIYTIGGLLAAVGEYGIVELHEDEDGNVFMFDEGGLFIAEIAPPESPAADQDAVRDELRACANVLDDAAESLRALMNGGGSQVRAVESWAKRLRALATLREQQPDSEYRRGWVAGVRAAYEAGFEDGAGKTLSEAAASPEAFLRGECELGDMLPGSVRRAPKPSAVAEDAVQEARERFTDTQRMDWLEGKELCSGSGEIRACAIWTDRVVQQREGASYREIADAALLAAEQADKQEGE